MCFPRFAGKKTPALVAYAPRRAGVNEKIERTRYFPKRLSVW
jgi:hypothetical protein